MGRDADEVMAWEKDRNSGWTNFKKNVSPIALIGFFGLILFGWYMISKSTANPTWIYLITGVVLALIIFRGEKAKPKEPIPDNIIKLIGLTLMRRKIGIEFPMGTAINLNGYCRMRFQGEWGQAFTPWKWEIGFEIRYADGLKETRLVMMHPYEGYITGIVKQPAGYTGEKSNDLKILMPLTLAVQEQKPK